VKIEYINPFVEAAFDILKEILNTNVIRGQLYLKKLGESMKGVAIIIGVVGNVKGRIVFDMSKETALKIASHLNNEEFTTFDPMVQSTICEVANLIVGRSVTKLEKEKLSFGFTPPTLIIGDNLMFYEFGDMEALIIPLETDFGIIEINIAFID